MGSIFNVLEGFEKLAYKLLIWIILIPKTIVKIILNPGFVRDYIHDELTNDKESPFDEYMSPMILYLGITLLPALAIYFLPQFGAFVLDPNDKESVLESNYSEVPSRVIDVEILVRYKSSIVTSYPETNWGLYQGCFLCNPPRTIQNIQWTDTGEFAAQSTDEQYNLVDLMGYAEQVFMDLYTIRYRFHYEIPDTDPGYPYDFAFQTLKFASAMTKNADELYELKGTISVPIDPSESMSITITPIPDYTLINLADTLYRTGLFSDRTGLFSELSYRIDQTRYPVLAQETPVQNFKTIPQDWNKALQSNQTILLGLGLLIPPLIFTLATSLFHAGTKRIGETDLKESFYAQCYYFVPVGLVWWAWYYSDYFYTSDVRMPTSLLSLPIYVIIIWFLIVETKAIARERQMQSVWHAIPVLVVCILIIVILITLGFIFALDFAALRKSTIWFYPIASIVLLLIASKPLLAGIIGYFRNGKKEGRE